MQRSHISPIRLLWPPLLPIAVLTIVYAAERAGYEWNIHREGALMAVMFLVLLLFAVVASLFSLASALPRLRDNPGERTAANVGSTAFAAAFTVLALAFLVRSAFAMVWS